MPENLIVHGSSFEIEVIDRLARIEEAAKAGAASSADHELRIRALEQTSWKSTGALSVLAAFAGYAGAMAEHILKVKF